MGRRLFELIRPFAERVLNPLRPLVHRVAEWLQTTPVGNFVRNQIGLLLLLLYVVVYGIIGVILFAAWPCYLLYKKICNVDGMNNSE